MKYPIKYTVYLRTLIPDSDDNCNGDFDTKVKWYVSLKNAYKACLKFLEKTENYYLDGCTIETFDGEQTLFEVNMMDDWHDTYRWFIDGRQAEQAEWEEFYKIKNAECRMQNDEAIHNDQAEQNDEAIHDDQADQNECENWNLPSTMTSNDIQNDEADQPVESIQNNQAEQSAEAIQSETVATNSTLDKEGDKLEKYFEVELIKFTTPPETKRHIEIFKYLKPAYKCCRQFIKDSGDKFKSAVVKDIDNRIWLSFNNQHDDHFYIDGKEVSKVEFDSLTAKGVKAAKAKSKSAAKPKPVDKPSKHNAWAKVKIINRQGSKKRIFEKIASLNGIVRYYEVVRDPQTKQIAKKLTSKSIALKTLDNGDAEIYDYDTVEHDRQVYNGAKFFSFIKSPTATGGVLQTIMTSHKTLKEAQESFKDIAKSIRTCGGYIEDSAGRFVNFVDVSDYINRLRI